MILKRMMKLSQQSPPRPKWSDRDRVAIFSRPASTTTLNPKARPIARRYGIGSYGYEKNDRRIVWPFL